jgi:predicted ATP-grasp superfamily ATP-dependent carboligase
LANEEGFVVGVQAILGRRGHAVLLPGSDASLLAVSKHRARFEGAAALGLPSHPIVIRCLDKLALSRAATEVGLAPPPTAVCSGLNDVESAASEFGFPVILKPHQAVVEVQGALDRPASIAWPTGNRCRE